MNVTFYLGKGATAIEHREFIVRNIAPTPNVILYNANQSGTTDTVTIDLPENAILQAQLIDYCKGNITFPPDVLNFNTIVGSQGLSFSSRNMGGQLRIIAVEETSSSSSQSSSTSSLSSLSSSSTSSLSSSSTSSASSSSTSSASSASTSSPARWKRSSLRA